MAAVASIRYAKISIHPFIFGNAFSGIAVSYCQ